MPVPANRAGVTRRDVLRLGGTLAAASVFGLPGCGGSDSSKKTLQLGTFASISSQFPIFDKLIADYRKQHPDVSIKVQPMPAESFYTQLDTRLAAGDAPDIVYMQHQSLGRYAASGSLVDLTPYLEEGYGDAFIDAYWAAVVRDDKVFGIPNQTNAFAIYYNKRHFASAGITDVPTSLEDAWGWDEFIAVAQRLKSKGVTRTPFAFDWTANNAYRWLPILYMHGGQLLADDLKTAAIDAAPGVESIEWTRRWFSEGLVPSNTSVKSSEVLTNLFSSGGISMMADGAWVMPVLVERMKDADWDVTYLFQDAQPANSLEGNSLAVTKDASDPETAADFVKFVADEANMKYYATKAQTIPTRKSLQNESLDYKVRAEAMNKVFVPSAATVPPTLAAAETTPQFGEIRGVLDDQLDLAFTSGQDAAETARNIAAGVNDAIERSQ